jgi:methylenetetrahydrofolate reductase (NADPH)
VASITDLLRRGPTFSFEFFPPRTDEEKDRLSQTIRDLEPLRPSFVSVTYRGGRSSRERTTAVVTDIIRSNAITAMPHLVCVAHSRLELEEIVGGFIGAGVENLLALGGDPVAEEGPGELQHAMELVDLARSLGGRSIGVAAHPAGHPRSPDRESDRHHLAAKLELADFAITQFFFHVEDYLRLREELAARGMTKPVIPGIMPILSLTSVQRMSELAGYQVPADIVDRLSPLENDPKEFRRTGIELASELCRELLDEGAPGLHFYTLNFSKATLEIYRSLELPAQETIA